MKSKYVIVILLLLLAIFAVGFVYSANESAADLTNKTELKVSSEGPTDLKVIVRDIKTKDCYKGYDNETLKWMESLGSKGVFVSDDAFVVMDNAEASKIPSQYVTDAYIDEFISCKIVENRSLGNGNNLKDVLLVKDAKYVGEEIHYAWDS